MSKFAEETITALEASFFSQDFDEVFSPLPFTKPPTMKEESHGRLPVRIHHRSREELQWNT
jgi:hypothetical protein